jgi:ribosomal protein S18 acetylase RimI-like enzyme
VTLRAGTPPPLRLEQLTAQHPIAAFSCGDAAIDRFLHSQALSEQTLGLSSVMLAIGGDDNRSVIGYFTLSPLSIPLDVRLLTALGLPKDKIPYPQVGGYLLGRLGVHTAYQRQGIGEALVAIAVEHARRGRAGAGGVYLAVDAKTDRLVGWYERLGFRRLALGRHRLVIRL